APLNVLTALLVFRLFYLLVPLAFALVVVVLFERHKFAEALNQNARPATGPTDKNREKSKDQERTSAS
ncbi:MAG: hypothetical protein ACYC5H_06970, partial [Methylovirgula sp.]